MPDRAPFDDDDCARRRWASPIGLAHLGFYTAVGEATAGVPAGSPRREHMRMPTTIDHSTKPISAGKLAGGINAPIPG